MEASEYFDLVVRREIPVIIDDDWAAAQIARLGFRILTFDDHDFSTPGAPALVVITRASHIARLHDLWSSSAVLFCHLALAQFESSPQSLAYSLSRLLSMDHRAALSRRADVYDRMLGCQDIEATTAGGALRCHMNDELEIANAGVLMEPGRLYSVAEFFEASVVNLESERSSFWIDGEIHFDGFIYLCNDSATKEAYGARLDQLMRRAAKGRNSLVFADNRIVRAVMGGVDVTETLLGITQGKERESAVTEVGIGCADLPGAEDWETNALLHKTCRGIYVGIGKGQYLPHLDFIAKGATIRYMSPV